MLKYIDRWIRSYMNEIADKAITRAMRDQYVENLFEMVPVSQKIGLIPLMETAMRASRGIPPGRPLGTYHRFSPWEQILFNPVHLFRLPISETIGIQTSVTIGPKAQKPLPLSIPILIAGMSYGGALSKKAKLALARAATLLGTATNTGEAGLLREERETASYLIGQYNRGGWLNQRSLYGKMDAIEIQLGQGAQGSSHQRTSAKNIGDEFREVFGLKKGEDAVIHSSLPEVRTKKDFVNLVSRLRQETGVPIGLKIAATHHLEKELEYAVEAGVDFITIDGAEGGTHGTSPTLEDDMGLPTLYGIVRAKDYLAKKQVLDDISLIATGGLSTPGQMLKAMAVGADAVYIGTAALMAMTAEQATESLPFEPPTSLVVYTGKMTDEFDIDKGVRSLLHFFNACMQEMEQVAVSLGKTALRDIGKSDLCTLDPFLSQCTGIELGAVSSAKQRRVLTEEAPLMHIPKVQNEGEQQLPLQ